MFESLLEALDDIDNDVRAISRQTLVGIGSDAVDELILAMQSPKLRLAWQAAVVLSQIPDARWIEPMIVALRSQNTLLAQTAVVALENALGRHAVTHFLNVLSSNRLVVQIALINALERLRCVESLEPLLRLLDATEIPELRYTIIQALGTLGDSSILPLVRKYEHDPNGHVRERVAMAIVRLEKLSKHID